MIWVILSQTTVIFSEDFSGVAPPNLPAGWQAVTYDGDGLTWRTEASRCFKVTPQSTGLCTDYFVSGLKNIHDEVRTIDILNGQVVSNPTISASFNYAMNEGELTVILEYRIAGSQQTHSALLGIVLDQFTYSHQYTQSTFNAIININASVDMMKLLLRYSYGDTITDTIGVLIDDIVIKVVDSIKDTTIDGCCQPLVQEYSIDSLWYENGVPYANIKFWVCNRDRDCTDSLMFVLTVDTLEYVTTAYIPSGACGYIYFYNVRLKQPITQFELFAQNACYGYDFSYNPPDTTSISGGIRGGEVICCLPTIDKDITNLQVNCDAAPNHITCVDVVSPPINIPDSITIGIVFNPIIPEISNWIVDGVVFLRPVGNRVDSGYVALYPDSLGYPAGEPLAIQEFSLPADSSFTVVRFSNAKKNIPVQKMHIFVSFKTYTPIVAHIQRCVFGKCWIRINDQPLTTLESYGIYNSYILGLLLVNPTTGATEILIPNGNISVLYSSGILYIMGKKQGTVKIYSMDGRFVKSIQFENSKANVGKLRSGIYIYHIDDTVGKFVVR